MSTVPPDPSATLLLLVSGIWLLVWRAPGLRGLCMTPAASQSQFVFWCARNTVLYHNNILRYDHHAVSSPHTFKNWSLTTRHASSAETTAQFGNGVSAGLHLTALSYDRIASNIELTPPIMSSVSFSPPLPDDTSLRSKS